MIIVNDESFFTFAIIVNERCIDCHIHFYITVSVSYTLYNLVRIYFNQTKHGRRRDMDYLVDNLRVSETSRKKKEKKLNNLGKPLSREKRNKQRILTSERLQAERYRRISLFFTDGYRHIHGKFFNCCALNFRMMRGRQ